MPEPTDIRRRWFQIGLVLMFVALLVAVWQIAAWWQRETWVEIGSTRRSSKVANIVLIELRSNGIECKFQVKESFIILVPRRESKRAREVLHACEVLRKFQPQIVDVDVEL